MPTSRLTAADLNAALSRRGMRAATAPDGTPLATVTKAHRAPVTLAELADVISEAERRAPEDDTTVEHDLDAALTALAEHARVHDDPTLALAAAALRAAAATGPAARASITATFVRALHPTLPHRTTGGPRRNR